MAKAARGKVAPQRKRRPPSPPVKATGQPAKRSVASEFLASLDDMSVAQLQKVIERAETLLNARSASERQAFIQDVKAKAAGLGLTIKDLLGEKATKPAKAPAAGKSRMSPPVKYRGPNAGETWTGRGRTPRWLAALEAEGRSRDEFAV